MLREEFVFYFLKTAFRRREDGSWAIGLYNCFVLLRVRVRGQTIGVSGGGRLGIRWVCSVSLLEGRWKYRVNQQHQQQSVGPGRRSGRRR